MHRLWCSNGHLSSRWRVEGAGPEVGGPYGPYRQSERTAIYKQYVDELVAKNLAYPCFCSDAEITQMKEEAERKSIPPIYRFNPWPSLFSLHCFFLPGCSSICMEPAENSLGPGMNFSLEPLRFHFASHKDGGVRRASMSWAAHVDMSSQHCMDAR